jgi:hypothetical protein
MSTCGGRSGALVATSPSKPSSPTMPQDGVAYEAERNAKCEALASLRTDLPLKLTQCAFR